jgi:hypothetical protein
MGSEHQLIIDKETLKSLNDSDKLNGLIDITWGIDQKLTAQFPQCRNRFVQKKHLLIGVGGIMMGYGGVNFRAILSFFGIL